MFTAKELKMIGRNYFRVLDMDDSAITLESKNTRHCWHIFRPENEYQQTRHVIIHHKHENQTEYHRHGYSKTFEDAIEQIKRHDNYQINTRWKGKSFTNGKKH